MADPQIHNLPKMLNVKTVLFQTIQFSMSTKLYGSKYCYISLTIQLKIQFSTSTQFFI